MLFNSYVFLFAFFPAVWILYYFWNGRKQYGAAKWTLTVASLIFYGYNKPQYALILISSIGVNYVVHRLLMRKRISVFRNRACLIAGLAFNIFLLVYFKYMGFLTQNINKVFHTGFTAADILLPLGISFFTFQQVSFLVDSYYKKTPEYSITDYALFVAFFPQLIAGPIVLHSEIIPQFGREENKRINLQNIADGTAFFATGLAKKVLVADTLGRAVDCGYAELWSLNSFSAVFVMLAYTFQIYFDFSGYCDMAMGLARMFNIELPVNFNSPYKAVSIADFWKRWHMTLTRFFTSYIYIPLGGNRGGKWKTYRNVMIVFAVSGLWHGADWSFVLWGLLHGAALVLCRMFAEYVDKWPKFLVRLGTFLFLNVTWVLFRADSVGQALSLYKRMAAGGGGGLLPAIQKSMNGGFFSVVFSEFPAGVFLDAKWQAWAWLVWLLGAAGLAFFARNTKEIVERTKPCAQNAWKNALLLALSILCLSNVSAFLYFNF